MKKLVMLLVGGASMLSSFAQDTLFVYGPGGPLAPMEECASVFSKKFSIPVKVTAGPEPKWIYQASTNADLVFGGAEYMLTQFAMQRPGNPKNIRSFSDLAKPGIKLLDVNGAGQLGMWEDLAGKQNLIAAIQKNIHHSFANTALGIEAWKSDNTYDAWINYASWHYRLKDVTALVKIPGAATIYRGTPIAITTITDQKSDAVKLISFLQTKEAHDIFIKWGWE